MEAEHICSRILPHGEIYFGDIRNHRDFIRGQLFAMIRDQYKREPDALRPPVVAVHVRRGDFRSLRVGEDFAHFGLVRTADQYFADLIEQIRHVSGWDLPVTVFSDGTDDEIATLTRIAIARPSSIAFTAGRCGEPYIRRKSFFIVSRTRAIRTKVMGTG